MTAVKWLDEQLQDTMYFVYGYTDGVRKVTIPLEDYMRLKQVALELEKEQIIDAYANAVMKENNSDYIGMHEQSSAEIYFAETYGSKGSDDHIVDTNEMVSSQTEISDGEIQSTAETFWTEPSESDMKRGWKLGAKWYREQLKSK